MTTPLTLARSSTSLRKAISDAGRGLIEREALVEMIALDMRV
jgi:hypothetical protein